MTIDDRLSQLLSTAVPSIAWYAGGVAGQGAKAPYGTFQALPSKPLNTQDRQRSTRTWRYQISVIGVTNKSAAALRDDALNFLIDFQEFNGVMSAIDNGGSICRFLDQQRLFQAVADVSIMENLP